MIEAVYMMLVMGCGDDLGGCELIRRVEQGWQTAATCKAAISQVLIDSTDADFPMVTGQCVSDRDALIAERPTPGSVPSAG